jgi:hypothetical protein
MLHDFWLTQTSFPLSYVEKPFFQSLYTFFTYPTNIFYPDLSHFLSNFQPTQIASSPASWIIHFKLPQVHKIQNLCWASNENSNSFSGSSLFPRKFQISQFVWNGNPLRSYLKLLSATLICLSSRDSLNVWYFRCLMAKLKRRKILKIVKFVETKFKMSLEQEEWKFVCLLV